MHVTFVGSANAKEGSDVKGSILDVAATLVSVGAGVYLLTRHSVSVDIPGVGQQGGQSWFEVIAHGMGAYFVAKGIWMARSLHLQFQSHERLVELVELDAARHGRETSVEFPPAPAD